MSDVYEEHAPEKCPYCGRKIHYDTTNHMYFDPNIIACMCSIGRASPIVAVEYDGKWFSPTHFLRYNQRDGIIQVKDQHERRTFQILRYEAMREVEGFHDQPYEQVRIFWQNGDAVGFYTDNEYFGDRGIGHIYVRKEYRRQGKATGMINHFMNQNPTGNMYILSPKLTMYKVLLKMGYAQKQVGGWKLIGRMKYMHAG